MKILVTGAKGQLGKKIIELLGKDNELILTDSDNMDITKINLVNNYIKSNIPDYIIHTAAYTKVDNAEDEKVFCTEINSIGTKNIATVAKENNIKLIYISTDFVFDGKKNRPYSEEDEPNPISVYGSTKYDGEKFIEQICEKYYILRVSWLFGELPENSSGTNFVETMLRLAKERSALSVINDQIGSPTYTKDLVEVISKIIVTSPKFGIYHFSGTGECSWYDFAKEIFKQTNTKIEVNPIPSNQYPQKANRPMYSCLDKSKIENILGLKVRDWRTMLSEYISKR